MHPIASWFSRAFSGLATKAAVPAPASSVAMPSLIGPFLTPQEITPYQAWLLYKSNATLAKVVDLIADNVSTLVPLVQINGKPVDQHPVTMFLNNPGFNRNRRRFIKELTVQQLVTGTGYVHCYGNPGFFPLALDVIKSKYLNPIQGQDGWIDTYYYSEQMRTVHFARDENPRDFRWFDRMTGLSELMPIYDMDGDARGVGLSRLNAVRLDIDLRLKGLQHNNSMLDKGARVSGVISYKQPLNDEQKAEVASQFRSLVQGSQNAGSILVTSAGEFDFQSMMQNAKDMDFAKLMQIVEDAIVSRYNVPVTLFRTEAQTNNNYETAWNILYDQAVLPTFQIIHQGLATMFSQRLGEQIDLTHDALTSPILAKQASARARDLFNAHLVSRNEARQIFGFEPVLGGDTIYGPMGEVPIGEDMFTAVDEALGRDALESRRERLAGGSKPAEGDEGEADDKPVTEGKKPRKKKPKPSESDGEAAQKSFGVLIDFAAALERAAAQKKAA